MALRAVRLTAMCVSLGLPLSACQAFLPRDETPVIPVSLAAAPPIGSSGQKLDAQGFPMIGHKPRGAMAQVSDEEVTKTETQYSRRAAGNARASDAGYRRDVAELQALAARQQAEADRALAAPAEDASSRAR